MLHGNEWVRRLDALNAQMHKHINRDLSPHGVSMREMMVLDLLHYAPSKSMRRIDLAEQTGVTASAITRLLNPLEKIGLIEKEDHPRDARVSMVKLTASGQRLYDEAIVTMGRSSDEFFTKYADEEKEVMGSVHEILSMIKNSGKRQ